MELSRPEGLLYVYMDPPQGDEQLFNTWYNDEHAPNRMLVPGILNGVRYQATGPEGPRYVARYDLQTLGALASPEYVQISTNRSDRERDVMSRLRLLDRRVLRITDWMPPSTDPAPFMLAVAMDPDPEHVDDFNAWYRDEHMPMLLSVPGWLRVCRYEQVEGTGPRFLALHDIQSLDVFEQPEYASAVNTPWRDRVMGHITRRERHVFSFYRAFSR